MTCLTKVAANITNSCSTKPTGGLEQEAYVMNRVDVTATADGTNPVLITALALAATTNAYKVTAVKKENNAGSDLVTADNLPDLYSHYYSLQPYERDSAAVKNLDDMDDVIMVVELKGPKTEGKFVILGLETGLHKTSMSWRANDNNGLPTYEFASLPGEEETYSRYVFWDTDYATTKAALENLLA